MSLRPSVAKLVRLAIAEADREARMTDDAFQKRLFDEMWEKLETLGSEDPAMANFNREPWAFSLTRHRPLLKYRSGPWSSPGAGQIGQGTIEWNPNPDRDEPSHFRIVRDTADDSTLRINDGPAMTVEATANDIVRTFAEQTDQ